MVLAEDGKKMSKRLKNYTPPNELIATYGADALRIYLINSGLVKGEEQRFSDSGVKDMVRRTLLPLHNSFKFLYTYANIDQWCAHTQLKESTNITDQWILSKLQTLKINIAKEMEQYHLFNVIPALFLFIEDLTNWYIRLNRSRFWKEELDDDKLSAFSTLYLVIKELSIALAPFTPFISEHIFQELKSFESKKIDAESVHLCDYPIAQEDKIQLELEDAFDRVQQIILLGRQKRNTSQIKVKIPLTSLTIIHKDQNILNEIKKLEHYIKTELNVKKINYDLNEEQYIKFYAKPNLPVLGKKLGKKMKDFRSEIQNISNDQIEELEKNNSITIKDQTFTSEDFLIFREAKEGTESLSNKLISINLDINLTPELEQEGLAREIVNRIQKTRKEINLDVNDRIHISYYCDEPKIVETIKIHENYISKETLSKTIKQVNSSSQDFHLFKIENMSLSLSIEVQK